ncbi:MAG: PAS domain S-box protein, partial [Magnetovibrio sp.]|nr:PAS domain S-box protein [Magnetovibrio sp.]
MNTVYNSPHRLTLIFCAFALMTASILYVLVARHSADMQQQLLLRTASESARALSDFRTYYSREIVSRAQKAGIPITHQFKEVEGSLPLPSTMTIDFGEFMDKQGSETCYRMFSASPFPWREDRKLDGFEEAALAALADSSKASFFRFESMNGNDVLRYAQPVVMGQTCVDCHNAHPESPIKNWTVGDVRGVQEVILPVKGSGYSSFSDGSFRDIMMFVVLTFSIAVASLVFLGNRNRSNINALRNLASRERAKGIELSQAKLTAEESAERLRAVLDNVADGIITADERGCMESVSPAAERIFGYDAVDILGQNVSLLMVEEHASRHDDYIQDFVFSGRPGIIGMDRELEGKRKDGTTFPSEISIGQIQLGGRRMFTGIVRDISDKKKAKNLIEAARNQLIDAIESLPDAFVLYDQNDRLVLCNAKYREFYIESADVIKEGATFEAIVREGLKHGQYADALGDEDAWLERRLAAHHDPDDFIEQQLNDGRWLRIEERKTSAGGIVGFRINITELKRREAALRMSEDRMRATVESSMDCIIIINNEGRVTEFNPAAEECFGYSREQAMGRVLSELIIPQRHHAAHREGIQNYFQTGEGPIIGKRTEVEAMRADGTEFLAELAVETATCEDGMSFIAYLRDITARHAEENALHLAKERAEEANRAKAGFLAMMSHEIRTPLNGVLGVLGLMEDTNLDQIQQAYVDTARRSGEGLLDIISDILDFSKMEAGKLEFEASAFALSPLMQSVVDMLATRAMDQGIDLTLKVDDDVPNFVEGDPGRLRQVILNLASNAVKFTDHGSVDILVKTVSGDYPEHALQFSVCDTGIGIPAEKHADLFAEFTTLDPSYTRKYGGTGLGLAISKKLVDIMNGVVFFESAPGKGSTFHFVVPLIPADKPDTELGRHGEETGLEPDRKLRILLAEDNPTNRMVAQSMLVKAGHHVDTAANGIEAVEAVQQRPYDAVLMDISMPEMDGIQATARIRELPDGKGNLPIIAMTAHAMVGDREGILATGMDDY